MTTASAAAANEKVCCLERKIELFFHSTAWETEAGGSKVQRQLRLQWTKAIQDFSETLEQNKPGVVGHSSGGQPSLHKKHTQT